MNEEQTSTALTCENGKGFNQNKNFLFERLITFLEQEGPINPVLAGYFRTLVVNIIDKQEKEMIYYLNNNGTYFLDLVVKHLYNKSISDIIMSLLNWKDSSIEDGAIYLE